MKFKRIEDSIKIYRISFNAYTNAAKTSVSDGGLLDKIRYIECDNGYVIISENEFNYYQQFGNGIRTMEYVGIMYKEEK